MKRIVPFISVIFLCFLSGMMPLFFGDYACASPFNEVLKEPSFRAKTNECGVRVVANWGRYGARNSFLRKNTPTLTTHLKLSVPRVAVFAQKGFPLYGPGEMSSPQSVALMLNKAGLKADLLNVTSLADPAQFNARNYDAVVLPYGNTYPQRTFANLRDFHRAGGCLIVSGVPFTHPVIQTKNERGQEVWKDLGHKDGAALFGKEGIGIGGFRDLPNQFARIAPNDTWGLASVSKTWIGHVQVLDTGSLPPGTQVLPALLAEGKPVAALIVHREGVFRNAVDAWTNYPNPRELLADAYAAEQLLARGTISALTVKGLLTKAQQKTAFRVLGEEAKPPVYRNLVLPTPPRPYPTLQPKRSPPTEHLYVADVRHLRQDEKLLLASLQGIVNREKPRIFLLWGNDDVFCLDVMQQQGHTGKPISVSDPFSLLTTFKAAYRGAVIPDPKVYASPCIAVDLAGLDDLVIATPELAAKWNLPIKTDLRGKFKDNADALRYARTTLLPRLNPFLALCLDPPLLGSQVDDIIAARGMAFWVTGSLAQDKPGADEKAEYAEIEATFAQMPMGGIIRGYWWSGDGMGLGEYPGVRLGSRFGKITTVSDYVGNYSVTSGITLTSLKQKTQPPAPKLDPSKVYLAITMSDGDNLCTFNGFWRNYFNDPLHGTFPLGYGMAPTLLDLSPPLVQWYYEHAAPTDEFLCDVSGVGYISPSDWGRALKDEPAAFRQFYDWTQDYMKRLDLKTIRINDVGAAQIARVGANLPETTFLMPDYGYADKRNYNELTYTLPTGQSVFRAASYGPKGNDLAREIRLRVGTSRPAFLNVFVFNWGSSLAETKQMLDSLGAGFVPVTPSQLNALYRSAKPADATKAP